MAVDQSIIDKKRAKKIAGFSSQYMSNSKWAKVFTTLSAHHDVVIKCFEKSIYDDVLRELSIPPAGSYNLTFDSEGIRDVNSGGPSKFKEIEWLEFPYEWTIKRSNRTKDLQPIQFYQDLTKIEAILAEVGIFEIESDLDKLKLYGYK